MKKLLFVPIAVAALAPTFLPAQGQDAKAAYDRSESLTRRVDGLVYNVVQTPTFIAGTPRLWYRKSVKGGNEFVARRRDGEDQGPGVRPSRARGVAESTAASGKYTAVTLPFTTLHVRGQPAGDRVHHRRRRWSGWRGAGGGGPARRWRRTRGDGAQWRCMLSDYTCTRVRPRRRTKAARDAGRWRPGPWRRRSGPGRRGRARRPQVRISPDSSWEALIQNFNVYVRPVRSGRGNAIPARTVHAEHRRLRRQRVHVQLDPLVARLEEARGVPASARVRAARALRRVVAEPISCSRSTRRSFYRKPGDVVDFDQPVVFDVATKQQTVDRQRAVSESVQQLAPRVARGQPCGHVRVQPARAPGLSRDRGRRARPGSTRTIIDETQQDVRRLLAGEAISGRRRSPTARRSSGCPSATAGSTCISTTASPAGEEPDHEGAMGRARRRSRRRGEPADLVPRQRHARRQGSVLHALLPRELRRHRPDAVHDRRWHAHA